MTRIRIGSLSGLLGIVLAVTSNGRLGAQETQAAPSSTTQSGVPESTQDASQPTMEPGKTDQTVADRKESGTPSQSAATTASVAKGKKKGEQEYTGPTTVVELPPTPMLDEEGKQRQDPDGKLMFNPPIRQQRDKKGHPLFDAGKPVWQTKDNLGYDENGKKLHAVKEKLPKTVSVSISRGTLTVDGLTGKAALNYEIKDLKYIYFYVPGIGTTVVSNDPFPGAVEQKHAFDDKTLTVTVGEHVLQLSSDNRLLGKTPESAFVLVDKSFLVPTKFPVVGYGPIRVAPYAWPGSKSNNEDLKGVVEAPPLPVDLRPSLLLQPCPAGQMRVAARPVLPGQTAPPNPCVPIVAGGATATSANQATQSTRNVQPNK
ncbi:MAG TPA: hypothetical protein VGG81_00625 [Edaphobacter sp.]|jgi:hypothetical protein